MCTHLIAECLLCLLAKLQAKTKLSFRDTAYTCSSGDVDEIDASRIFDRILQHSKNFVYLIMCVHTDTNMLSVSLYKWLLLVRLNTAAEIIIL